MRIILFSFVFCVPFAKAYIADNSFLVEEAYNQESGVYQFVQQYQTTAANRIYDYSFTGELPITHLKHQFSFEVPYSRSGIGGKTGLGDVILSYRWQPYNHNGKMEAHRFGLILPTGGVEEEHGNGVTGVDYVFASTSPLGENFQFHWNLGGSYIPEAKLAGKQERENLMALSFASGLVYHWHERLDLLVEFLTIASDSFNYLRKSEDFTYDFILNQGVRSATLLDWKNAEIVGGLSFPVRYAEDHLSSAVLVYLSVEPNFN